MTRPAGSPPGGSGGSSSGDLPGGAGPFVVSGGAWVQLDAAGVPASPDTNVQDFLDALDTSIGTLNDALTMIGSEIDTLQSAVSALQTNDSTQDSAISALQSAVSTLQSQYTSLSSTVSSQGSSITTLQSDVSALQSSVSALSSAVSALSDVAYTRTTNDTPTPIGSSPTYTPILTLTIAPGETRILDGFVLLSGGTEAAPTSGVIAFGGVSSITVRRGSGSGAPTLSGTPAVVGGTIAALAAQIVVSGNDIVLQARATGGPSVTKLFFYRWDLDTP